jgi:3-oxoadipate enol-lactonase
MREVVVDGGRIYAEEVGTGDPVLMLHAGVADRRVWSTIAPAVAAAGYRVITYDMRGYGRSAAPTGGHSLAADALAVLDAATATDSSATDPTAADRTATDSSATDPTATDPNKTATPAHFVGLSQGAATSVDVALRHPERVRSLTLVAPGLTGYDWPRLPGFARRMAAAEAGDAHRLAVEIARLWAPMSFLDDRCLHDTAAQIIIDQAEQFMRDEMEIEEPSAVDGLDRITAPTLIVLGDSDVAPITDIGRHLAANIPRSVLEILPGADHMVPLRVPEQFTELLLAHLALQGGPTMADTANQRRA